MHPVEALKLLFGPLARYTATSARPLPDGTHPVRGVPCDWRDPDQLRMAGRLSSALLRVRAAPGGDLMVAMLETFFSRAGLVNQDVRLTAAIEAMHKQGLRLCRRMGKERGRRMYRDLLALGVAAFAYELRRAG